MTIRELRSRLKEVLDSVDKGEVVTFERDGRVYTILRQDKHLKVGKTVSAPVRAVREDSVASPQTIVEPPEARVHTKTVAEDKVYTFCKHSQVIGFCKHGCKVGV